MLPDNSLSSKLVRAPFQYPDRVVRTSLLEDYEMGGIALSDPSQGHEYQAWRCHWRYDWAVVLKALKTGQESVMFYSPDVFELAFTFDQNMRWACATQSRTGQFQFRWYDTAVGTYVTTELEGVTAFHCTLDDKRPVPVQLGNSDTILTYLKGSSLYFRAQRERFSVEHQLADDLPLDLVLTNFGMNDRLRLQWRFRYRVPSEKQPWLL